MSGNARSPIGGFFEQHDPDEAATGPSVLQAWTEGRPYAAFVNARSAFAALAATFPDAAVWLPAFLCSDLIDRAYAARVRFYPVLDGFEPDLAGVDSEAKSGDLVLLVAYFGLPISAKARDFAARRSDLRIVEDRAQALGPDPESHSDWRLYSPRKLLGVADGGLLVGRGGAPMPPGPTAAADADALWAAPRLRSQDPLGRNNAAWHALNQATEGRMAAADEAMTPLSQSILARTALHRRTHL